MTTFTAINLIAIVVILFAVALAGVAAKVRRMDEELAQARLELIKLKLGVENVNAELARQELKDLLGRSIVWKMT